MHILCKEKDYYDYVGYNNGDYGNPNSFADVTFDRREMWVIAPGTNYAGGGVLDLISKVADSKNGNSVGVMKNIIGLWLGYNLYIFRIDADPNRWERNMWGSFLKDNFDYNIELLAHRKIYDIKHNNAVEFVKIDVEYLERLYKSNWKDYFKAIKTDKGENKIIEEFQKGNPANWKFSPYFERVAFSFMHNTPILKNTWVPKYVPAEEAYYAIEEWLIAQHNDVDQESKGITDVEKAVNHGFDKKASFRNVK